MHYGHELQFGTFITPTNDPPQTPVRARRAQRGRRLRPGHLPGPPLPATLPRHVDPAHVGRRAHRAHPRSRRTSPTCRCARPPCSRARPRASTCCRTVDSNSGSAPAASGTRSRRWAAGKLTPGQARRRALRGDRHHPRHLGSGRAVALRGRRHVLPRERREARAGAGAQHPDPDRRLQAAHAAAHRSQGRRLGALARLHEAGRVRREERHHRRGRHRRRPRSPRDPPHREHRRAILDGFGGRRIPRRARRAVGGATAALRRRRRRRHVRARERRPRNHPALRRAGRARAA